VLIFAGPFSYREGSKLLVSLRSKIRSGERMLAQSSERTACRRLFPYGSSNPRAGSEHGGESPGTRNPLQFVRSAVLENEG
jgi:hypothetical protein